MDNSGPNSPIYPLTKNHSYSTPRSFWGCDLPKFMGYPWSKSAMGILELQQLHATITIRIWHKHVWNPEWFIYVLQVSSTSTFSCCQATQCVHLGPRWLEIAASVNANNALYHAISNAKPCAICMHLYVIIVYSQSGKQITHLYPSKVGITMAYGIPRKQKEKWNESP